MTENQERSAVGFMSRHLVALAVEYEAVEKDGKIKGSSTMVFSGWLLELHDTCFWVTAGHCLKDALDENIDAGYIVSVP